MTSTTPARGVVLLAAALAAMFAARPQGSESAAEQLPPVYFNHSDIVLPTAAYEAIAQSKFLKEEFSYFSEATVHRSDTDSFTFLGVNGRRTYLAIFKPALAGSENLINFNMWIDDRARLPLIRDSLIRNTHLDAILKPTTRIVRGQKIDTFDVTRVVLPKGSVEIRVGTEVISRYAEALPQLFPDLKPEQYRTTREIDQSSAHRYIPERLLNDVTRFTVTLSKSEADQLLPCFRAYGYMIRKDGEKQIVTGPEIEFVLLNAEPGSQRKLAIDMKLNRAKAGDQSYTFGSGSELSFNGDTATWYFPAGWRP